MKEIIKDLDVIISKHREKANACDAVIAGLKFANRKIEMDTEDKKSLEMLASDLSEVKSNLIMLLDMKCKLLLV